MKTSFALLAFLLFFSFLSFGQVVDTAAAVREVDSLIQVSRALTGKRDFDKAIEMNAAAEKIAREKLGRESVAYGNCCLNHGRVACFSQNYPEAEKWWLEARAILEKVLGKAHPNYASSLHNLAELYGILSKHEKSEALHLEAKAIREKALGNEHPDYALSLAGLALLYSKMSKYEQAEPLYLEAKAVFEKVFGNKHYYYRLNLNNLASLYLDMGKYEQAEPLYLEIKAIDEEALGKEHPNYYAMTLYNLALLYDETGYYEQAEELHLEAKAIREKVLGKEHPDYAMSLNGLATLYVKMGNYRQAELLYLEAKAIREKVLGKEHPEYASGLNDLAILYFKMGNYEQAEQLWLQEKAIWDNGPGKEDPEYAANLTSLAILYTETGNYAKAELLQVEAKNLLEKVLGKEHPSYAKGLLSLGQVYAAMGKYEQAGSLYSEAKAIFGKVVGKEHPMYAFSLYNLGDAYVGMGKCGQAGPLFDSLSQLDRILAIKALRHLSEQELNLYVQTFENDQDQVLSFAQSPRCRYSAISRTCYDNSLFYKGFLLHAAGQVKRLSLLDAATTDKFNLLKSYERRLAAQYALPIAERDSALVPDLETRANDLEKKLAHTVAGFGEALRQVTWQEVQAALKTGEAAIEFIRFQYYNPNPTDSTLYAALLVKPEMATPAFITLFEEKQLVALLAPLAEQGSSGLNELYGGQAGQLLHRLLWSPIEPHLTGVKTVYYSPSGLLHRLNLGAMPLAEGTILADRHELVCLGSTRQLVTAPAYAEATAGKTATAMVYGGIQFDMDSAAYPVQRNLQDDNTSDRRGLSFEQSDSTLRLARHSLLARRGLAGGGDGGGDVWQYLKWSEKEADNVQNILTKAGVAAETRKGWQATEESFKQIGKDKPSPRILHISTHGFFFPDPKSEVRSERVRSEMSEPVFKMSDHPMIRSGLILAGGNYAWKTGHALGNREDGILTAYEISQMNLAATDLVVLSACETGLGQIEGNEGVYGLQRAFKIAGAKYLVMSLWQVPDYQTQELMTVFYSNILEKKMPVRQALYAAQGEMRQKRYEPFYWAGFVLVE